MSKRIVILMLGANSIFSAADFSLTIGSSVRNLSTASKVKGSVLAVRLEDCENLARAQITGTAEGSIDNVRKSVPLQLTTTSAPNVYVVSQTWAAEGAWVLNLKATCADKKAGAVVPIGKAGFLRGIVRNSSPASQRPPRSKHR